MMRRAFRTLLTGVVLALAAVTAAAAQIQDLREQQARRLDELAAQYSERAQGMDRASGEYRRLLAEYSADASAIRQEMKTTDPRAAELEQILRDNPEIANTGSVPRDVNADVDLAASSDAAADRLTAQWRDQYGADNIEVLGHKIINHATDTTLWLPDTPERLEMKLTDPDAFYAEGGRHLTGVPGAVRNHTGWTLSNYQKFAHAHAHDGQPDNLQIMGKSLSKVYESNSPDARAAGGVAESPEVIRQATALRNYSDVYQAGIADLGDSPEEVERKIAAWKAQAADAFATEEVAALERSRLQEQVQQSLADTVADAEIRREIAARLERSRNSNAALLQRLREVEAEVGIAGAQSARVMEVRAQIAAHVEGPGPESRPTPIVANVDIQRPTPIVSDAVRSGAATPDAAVADVFGAYDRATLAFDPVGALTELAAASPDAPPQSRLASGAGYLLTAVNLGMNYEQVWQEAERGGNVNISFDEDDSETVRRMKAAGAALLETSGAPGFMRDLGDAVAAEFDQGDPDASTLQRVTMTAGRILAKSADDAIVRPLRDTIEAGGEFAGLVAAVAGEIGAGMDAAAQQGLVAEARDAARQRELAFNLAPLRGWIGARGGDFLLGAVRNGQTLVFEADRNGSWTADFAVEWFVQQGGLPAAVAPRKAVSADSPDANLYQIAVQDWPAGEYSVALFVRDASGRLHARETSVFSTGLEDEEIGLGSLGGWLDRVGGPPIDGEAPRDRRLAFAVARLGAWTDAHRVEWFVDGDLFQTESGANPAANMLDFGSVLVDADRFEVAVRLLGEGGEIIDYQSMQVAYARDADPFSIAASLDQVGGPPLTGPVANGATLAFVSDVPLPTVTDGGAAPISELLWQVYGPDGAPVPALAKREQLAQTGPYRSTFRFRPDSLANGVYRVVLSHVVQSDGGATAQAQSDFQIYESVRVRGVVVTDRPDGAATDLTPGDTPHIYVYYALGEGVPSVRADMRVAAGGATVFETSVERPVNGDPAAQRVGVALTGASITGDAEFEVTLTPPGGAPVSARQVFAVRDYVASVSLDLFIPYGTPTPYSISVPDVFQPPLDVKVDAIGVAVNQIGPLEGLVESRNPFDSLEDASISFTVRDATGRTVRADWSGYAESDYEAMTPEPYVALEPDYYEPSYDSYDGDDYVYEDDDAYDEPQGLDLTDALTDFNNQMAQIAQDYSNEMNRIQREYEEGMAGFGSSGSDPYGMQSSGSGGRSLECVVEVMMHNPAGMGRTPDGMQWSPVAEVAETGLGCSPGSDRRDPVSVCGYQLFVNRAEFDSLVSEARSRGASEFLIRQAPGNMWDDVASCPIF